MTLVRPNCVEIGPEGTVAGIYCKICGDKIAGTSLVPKGSGLKNNIMVEKFRRFNNYAEIKIAFDDGHMHVTHGCKRCLGMDLPVEILSEMHNADMGMMPGVDATPYSEPVGVVAMDLSGQGIV